MSAVIMLRQKDRIHLLTDGAEYFEDGIVANFREKTKAFPDLGCAITTLGPTSWQPIVFDAIRDNFRSFDDLKAGIGPVLQELFDRHARTITRWSRVTCMAWVVGWSKRRRRPEGFTISMDHMADYEESNDPHLLRPFVVSELHPIGIHFNPVPDLSQALFPTSLTASDKLVPEIDLLQIMELQRRHRFERTGHHLVGGFATLTTVTRHNVRQRRIHTWPDVVGARIEPTPVERYVGWLHWRAERQQSFRNPLNNNAPANARKLVA
ncbi:MULTISPECIES: hypothetical protein [unclassified Bradyrhizobium]|uniref:hypothetical protein n=1 Tax=unclassified Bradyrhizobium TaxID=2631580 RepID=UPI00247A6E9C|nr:MULTISPECIES: hypothetical protein [unclassified Bradyrhizobium]WGS18942.1 hypothetical protein MTX22_31185 [Bradyrhizobium sp. ISRA463]WGS25775.1 hypothetical protein MTX19_28755 [Bradyrhizobium sp. ISRA464]